VINHNVQQDASPSGTASKTNANALRVLVVEDDASMLRLYQTVLPAWPMLLDTAFVNNGTDAMFKMRSMRPHLMVLDLDIPGINGFKVLNETFWNPGTTVVVVSGLDEQQIHCFGGIPQGIEVLPKPVPFARLMAIAKKIADNVGVGESRVAV